MSNLDTTPAPSRDDIRYTLRRKAIVSLREISTVLTDTMRDMDDEAWAEAAADWQAAHKALGQAGDAIKRMARRLEA